MENNEYHEMEKNDKQYSNSCTRNCESGNNISSVNYNSLNYQSNLPLYKNNDDIECILLNTPYFKASKDEIFNFMKINIDSKSRTKYIQSIFNQDITEFILMDGRRVGYHALENVVHFWEGSYTNRKSENFIKWEDVLLYFEDFLDSGKTYDDIKPIILVERKMTLVKENVEHKYSTFSFSQELIDRIISLGTGIPNGKIRIYEQFLNKNPSDENILMLKHEYGMRNFLYLIDNFKIKGHFDDDGIHLQKNSNYENQRIDLNWNQIEDRILELIKEKRYLNSKEKDTYIEWKDHKKHQSQEISKNNVKKIIKLKKKELER